MEAEAEEAPKEPEAPKELEEDAASDSRKKVAPADVGFNMSEATLNVLPTMNDKLLMTFSDGGLQYLLAGVRSTVGLKAGRYMLEAKILECVNPVEPQGSKTPAPKQLVRLGLSTSGSSVFLAESADFCCFDSEGFFIHGRKRSKVAQKFTFGETAAVLLNLDPSSPNANTVSLFKNGERASEPQPLPEQLKGKTLFPTFAYKNVTLQVNFGPKPLVPLPFKCRMVKDAAAADVEIVKALEPKNGQHEVLFPMGMPDAGVFQWADQFLEKNPTFVEISDRKIIEWAAKSGIQRPQPVKSALDSPDMNFGIPLLDDLSVRKLLSVIAPALNRSFLVMELKANLIPAERKEAIARFGEFKKVAVVAMGEPDADYKAKVQADILNDKKAKAEEAKKKKAREEERKRLLEEKKRKAEEARKAKLAAQRKKEGKEEEEEVKEEEKEEDKKEEIKEEEPEPVIELTEEEKKQWHKKLAAPDISQATLSKSYASFALPEESDGFDEIRYVWQKQAECSKILGEWIHERKMTQRVEDLTPGDWFKGLWTKWQKAVADWKRKQSEWKDPSKRKALLAKKKQEAKKKKDEEKKEAGEAEEGEEAAAEEEAAEDPMEINAEDLDVFSVEDVTDIGSGEPLFANFVYEDWTLLAYRVEFHLMLHAWKKDVNDPERPSFKENHMPFYYKKYFKKEFGLKNLGVEKLGDFIDWINEAVKINDTSGFFEAQLDEELPFEELVKMTEEHRRDRQRRVDAGDETAKLKFTKAVATAAVPAGAAARPVGVQPSGVRTGAAAPVGLKRPIAATQSYGGPQKLQRVAGYAPAPAYGAPRPAYGAPPAYGAYQRPAPGYGAIRPGAPAYGVRPVYGGGYYR